MIPLFFVSIPIILVAGTACFLSVFLVVIIYNDWRYSSRQKCKYWDMFVLPYLILTVCMSLVFSFYVIVLEIVASPVILGYLIYVLTDEYRY